MFANSAIYLLGALSGLGLSMAQVPTSNDGVPGFPPPPARQIIPAGPIGQFALIVDTGCILVNGKLDLCAQDGPQIVTTGGGRLDIYAGFDGGNTDPTAPSGCHLEANNLQSGSTLHFTADNMIAGQACTDDGGFVTTNPYNRFAPPEMQNQPEIPNMPAPQRRSYPIRL